MNFYMKFLLELGFEVIESVITCYEYGIFPLRMNFSMEVWVCMD